MSENAVRTGKKCSACKEGEILMERYEQYRPFSMGDVMGPGAPAPVFKTNLFCEKCGVSYHHLPECKKGNGEHCIRCNHPSPAGAQGI